jgi:ATP-dependent DNA helicase RecG
VSEAAPSTLRRLASIDVRRLRHVGEKRALALGEMGIESVFDLLTLYPRRYLDRTRRVDVSDLSVGDEAAVFGQVRTIHARRTRQGRAMVEASVGDDGDTFKVVFFNQAWRERQLAVGVQALFFGKVADFRGQRQMTNPVVDVIVGPSGEERDPSRIGRVVAIYPASGKAGLTSWEMGGFVEEALRRAGPLVDPVPERVRAELGLEDRTASMWGIHVPRDGADVDPARRRLVFDEFLRLQLLLALRRQRVESSASGVRHEVALSDLDAAPGAHLDDGSLLRRFLSGHRFALTGAQRRVLGEIARDMASPVPMHRLLQGDVGSGKTLVATGALLMAVDGGRQGALMAPTEVLAEQHAAALRLDLAGLDVDDPGVLGARRAVSVALLTGRTRARERRAVLGGLADGSIDLVVGTHSLLSGDVRFRALGAVVIDEQHRFGVEQRATLRAKGREHSLEGLDPDVLVMTATPIPRTAAMVVFGDLDRSVLDELPGGRVPIDTKWARAPEEVAACWHRVREEVALGRRAYVVCPLVEGSDRIEAASAVAEHARLSEHELAGLRVGLLHGQMKGADKDGVMASFRRGELDVLVATVVIEVGVDVAEASVIVIEDAWRFGLAQLHQLRGRVGRADTPSVCFLLGTAPHEDAGRRLEALVATRDGFELAEIDLDLRGEGTLLGARQQGRSDLRLASLRHDEATLLEAREAARRLAGAGLAEAPELVDELRLFVDDDEADYLFKS